MGIISGLIAGALYNRYSDIKLPDYLAFFAGRRFVPIVAGAAGLVVAFVFGLGFPVLERGMDAVSHGVIESGSVGLFVYGVLNRLLIVTGLHHILNNVAWFIVGDFHGATGDLKRFFAGDPSAGAFMSGFFPVMMFGLPAACLAMYRTALPERRRAVGGLLLSMALTSFLTGVTEPIEFTFMFLAPVALRGARGAHRARDGDDGPARRAPGFGFSAGLFDYVLNFNKATHPWLLLPVGAVYALLYYGLFRYCIERFDLKTPGRDADEAPVAAPAAGERCRARGRLHRRAGRRGQPARSRRVHHAPAPDARRSRPRRCQGFEAPGCARHRERRKRRSAGGRGPDRRPDRGRHARAPRRGAGARESAGGADRRGAGRARATSRASRAAPGRVLVTLKDGAKADGLARFRAAWRFRNRKACIFCAIAGSPAASHLCMRNPRHECCEPGRELAPFIAATGREPVGQRGIWA